MARLGDVDVCLSGVSGSMVGKRVEGEKLGSWARVG